MFLSFYFSVIFENIFAQSDHQSSAEKDKVVRHKKRQITIKTIIVHIILVLTSSSKRAPRQLLIEWVQIEVIKQSFTSYLKN